MYQMIFVVLHITHGIDGNVHLASGNGCRAYAKVIDHIRRYGDGANLLIIAGFFIHRNQVHPHGGFTRFITLVIGVHRRDPVERFLFGCRLTALSRVLHTPQG